MLHAFSLLIQPGLGENTLDSGEYGRLSWQNVQESALSERHSAKGCRLRLTA